MSKKIIITGFHRAGSASTSGQSGAGGVVALPAEWPDVLRDSHKHLNKILLDSITAEMINRWNSGGILIEPGDGILISKSEETGNPVISHADTSSILAPYVDKFGHVVEDLDFRFHPLGGADDRDFKMRNGTVYGSLSSDLFVSGFPSGTGWAITSRERENAAGVAEKLYSLEIDEITVRRQFRAYEMIISQLLGENGTRLTTDMMRVASVDAETNTIYLDTEAGLLYNPFRVDDVIRVQVFGGVDDSVIKSYEFVVDAVGLGTEDGQARVDWLRFRNFVGELSDVASRDSLVRIDNLTNPDRKGLVKTTSVEPNSPYMDVVYGMATDPGNSVRLRMGKLSGIITPEWGRCEGYGLFSDNVYLKGRFALTTGEDVLTKFNVMEGNFTSEMNSLREEVLDKDNLLQNASWGDRVTMWQLTNDVSMFVADDRFMYLNSAFYAEQQQVTAVMRDAGRYAMYFRNGRAVQLNADIKDKPETSSTLYVSLRVKCIEAGTLRVGIFGSALYHTVALAPSDKYELIEFNGKWSGTGNFAVEFTGRVYVYAVALTRNQLEDLRTEFTTKIEQTQYEIALLASETRGNIESLNSRLSVTSSSISAVSSRVNSLEIASSGWVTTADATRIFAQKNDIISYINVSAEAITISSDKINIDGIVNRLVADNVFVRGSLLAETIAATNISTGRLTVTDGAKIGGMVVEGGNVNCNGAYFSNFGWYAQDVTSDIQMGSAVFYNCKNTSPITLTLPSDVKHGRLIYVRSSGTSRVTVKASGSFQAIRLNGNSVVNSLFWDNEGFMGCFFQERLPYQGVPMWCWNKIGL